MRAVLNSYTPNAGAEPVVVVGRDDQLDSFDLLLERLARGSTEQSMIITGLRGVGKTVLLGQSREKAVEREWVEVDIEVSKHDDTEFRRDIGTRLRVALLQFSPKAPWTDRFKHAAAVLTSFSLSGNAQDGSWSIGLDVAAAEVYADHARLKMDLTVVLIAIGEAARERGRGAHPIATAGHSVQGGVDLGQSCGGGPVQGVLYAVPRRVAIELPLQASQLLHPESAQLVQSLPPVAVLIVGGDQAGTRRAGELVSTITPS